MFGKPTRPETAPLHTLGGVVIAMIVTYLLIFGSEITRGTHVVDLGYVSNLATIGILVVGYGWYENRR